LRQLAVRRNLEIVDELTESCTAKVPGRPVFNEMMTRIKKGEADGILAWHPDRLARNSTDGAEIMQFVDDGLITHLEFCTFWFEPTPQGKLMLGIIFGMSKYYTDSLSQNIKRAQRQRIQNGYWPRRPPIGYLNDRNTRTVVPDPAQAPLVRKIFELYATGQYTLKRLQQVMTAAGLVSHSRGHEGKPFPLGYYYKLLQNPFYVSLLRLSGELFEGKHESLVTTRLFDACQMVRLAKGKYRTPVLKPFLYRGMFTCGECGCMMTMEIKKGITYVRCTKSRGHCEQRYVHEQQIAKQITQAIRKMVVQKSWIDGLVAHFESVQLREIQTWNQEIKMIKAKIAEWEAKLQRLTDLYVEGTRPLAEYNKTKERLLKSKRLETEKLSFAETHRKTPLEPVISFIQGLTEPQAVIDSNDLIRQRDFLQKAASNLQIRNKRVHLKWRGAWKHVAELGVFARRHAATCGTPASSDAAFHSGCPECSALRESGLPFYLFFKEYPAWA
jgi:DNA invertase Pin-like site-specific DNA recombinase